MARLTVVLCCEKGILETYTMVCVHTLRRFGGTLVDADIYIVAPRQGRYPSSATKSYLKSKNVEIIEEDLNKKYASLPLFNKPVAAAFVETRALSDSVAFLDSDTLVWREPVKLICDSNADVRAAPVHATGIGSTGPNDKKDIYWRRLYALLGIDLPAVSTSPLLEFINIRPYYNSGVLSVKRGTGIYRMWKKDLETAIEAGFGAKEMGGRMIEQSVFAASVQRLGIVVDELPATYNYPVQAYKNKKLNSVAKPYEAYIWHHTNRLSRVFDIFHHHLMRKGITDERIGAFVDDVFVNHARYLATNVPWAARMRAKLGLRARMNHLLKVLR